MAGDDDTRSDIRRIRIDDELWKPYEEIVGNGGRSADIREYVAWRIDHPTTPLPGRRRGPTKKVRKGTSAAPTPAGDQTP